MNADTVAVSAAASHSIFTALLIGVIALQFVAIITLIRHHGGWDFVANLPTTNLFLLGGNALFMFFNVALVLTGYSAHYWPPVDVILAIEGALLLNMGKDVTQYGVKRFSTNPDIASTQNVQSGITPGPPISPPAPPAETDAKATIVPVPAATNTNDPVRDKVRARRQHTGD